MNARESAESAKAYYTEEARQEYYFDAQEMMGHWGGKGAARLGLTGPVGQEAFFALCDNLHPQTQQPLTPRTREKRTVGYDLNWHCPKSVSVVHAWNQDPRILIALEKSVGETMAELEQEIRTRVRLHGTLDGDRQSGNLIWSTFIHQTTRPVDGIPDPHLHIHCFTFNATFDQIEERWKAGQFREINRKAPSYQAKFLLRLSNKLYDLGYPVRQVGKGFEIEGVPHTVSKKFSKRTERIEQYAKDRGIKDEAAKAQLGVLTREKKRSDLTIPQLRVLWQSQLTSDEILALNQFRRPKIAHTREALGEHQQILTGIKEVAPKLEMEVDSTVRPVPGRLPQSAMALLDGQTAQDNPTPLPKTIPTTAMRDALDRSILHNFERKSVVTPDEIMARAMIYSIGKGITPEMLQTAMDQHPDLIFGEIQGRKGITTRKVLKEEQAMAEWVKKGKGFHSPLVETYAPLDPKLDAEQRKAVEHILASQDRVTALEGKSGTGKTWLMREIVGIMEADHQQVLVLAPSSETVNETLQKQGFPNSQTVSQLLVNEKLQEQYAHGIWWVDEAGQLSAGSMNKLFALADWHGARVVLSGDVGQHRAVERGDALKTLYDYAGLEPASLTTIRRQTGSYRTAVEHLAAGRILEGYQQLDADGRIHEIAFPERYKALAAEYVQESQKAQRPLVISPTHEECRQVTQEIRKALKADGTLGKDYLINNLRPVDLTEADKADWHSYRQGLVLELVQATPGTQAGTRMTVDSIDPQDGAIYVKKPDGSIHAWNLHEYANRFQVYEPDQLILAEGDRIQITKNGKAEYGNRKVTNSTVHTFVGLDEHGDVKLANGMILSRDFAHLNYGYAITSFKAQGKSVDVVIVAESAQSFGAASLQQFYVSASRGKIRPSIYTNSKAELFEAIQIDSHRPSAMELTSAKPIQKIPLDHEDKLRNALERTEARVMLQAEKMPPDPLKEHLGNQMPEMSPLIERIAEIKGQSEQPLPQPTQSTWHWPTSIPPKQEPSEAQGIKPDGKTHPAPLKNQLGKPMSESSPLIEHLAEIKGQTNPTAPESKPPTWHWPDSIPSKNEHSKEEILPEQVLSEDDDLDYQPKLDL